jgi:hypothetical protein
MKDGATEETKTSFGGKQKTLSDLFSTAGSKKGK